MKIPNVSQQSFNQISIQPLKNLVNVLLKLNQYFIMNLFEYIFVSENLINKTLTKFILKHNEKSNLIIRSHFSI